jgi:hypothetical protein
MNAMDWAQLGRRKRHLLLNRGISERPQYLLDAGNGGRKSFCGGHGLGMLRAQPF